MAVVTLRNCRIYPGHFSRLSARFAPTSMSGKARPPGRSARWSSCARLPADCRLSGPGFSNFLRGRLRIKHANGGARYAATRPVWLVALLPREGQHIHRCGGPSASSAPRIPVIVQRQLVFPSAGWGILLSWCDQNQRGLCDQSWNVAGDGVVSLEASRCQSAKYSRFSGG